jgi:glutamyl-tRNA reductase
MGESDIVISSSAAAHFLIGQSDVRAAVEKRNGRPLLMIDIAVPRDIDPVVREFPQVHLFDIDDLQAVVAENLSARAQELGSVEGVIDESLGRFGEWLRGRGVVPTVAALTERAEQLRRAELAKTLKRLPELNAEQQAAVAAMSSALVKKVLHEPVSRLKGADGERFAATLRELFALDDEVPPNGASPGEV